MHVKIRVVTGWNLVVFDHGFFAVSVHVWYHMVPGQVLRAKAVTSGSVKLSGAGAALAGGGTVTSWPGDRGEPIGPAPPIPLTVVPAVLVQGRDSGSAFAAMTIPTNNAAPSTVDLPIVGICLFQFFHATAACSIRAIGTVINVAARLCAEAKQAKFSSLTLPLASRIV